MEIEVDKDSIEKEARASLDFFADQWVVLHPDNYELLFPESFHGKVVSVILENSGIAICLSGEVKAPVALPLLFGATFDNSDMDVALIAGAAYAWVSLKEAQADCLNPAWEFLLISHAWRLRVKLIICETSQGDKAISERAKYAAKQRHKKNHEIKQRGIDWFNNHRHEYTSKDSAAEALTDIVPVTWRTARAWLNLL